MSLGRGAGDRRAGAITVFFPFFWMAVTSLKTVPEIQRVPLQILPDRWGNLDNYREVFVRQPFGRFLLNSALVASRLGGVEPHRLVAGRLRLRQVPVPRPRT